MKNVILISVLLLTILMIGSCGSTPPAEEPVQTVVAPTPAPVTAPAPAPAPVVTAPVPTPAPAPAPTTPAPAPAPAPTPAPSDPYTRHAATGVILNGAPQYTVRAGDTLSQIAWRFYEDGSYYPVIMLVSDDIGSDPDIIEPGMQLIIPSLVQNLNDSRARQSINRILLEIAQLEDQRGRHGTAALMREHAN